MRDWNGWPWIAGACALVIAVLLWLRPASETPLRAEEISAFLRPRTLADPLPPSVVGAVTALLPESSRLAGRYGEASLYVVQSQDARSSPCLIVYPRRHPGEWSIGCAGGMTAGVRNDAAGLIAYADRPGRRPEGWVVIDVNVSVDPTP